MDPSILEVDLEAVDGVDLFLAVAGFELGQEAIQVDSRGQFHLVLGDEIRRILPAQLRGAFAGAGQVCEEQGDAHQGVAAVVEVGIDDPAITFAADHGVHLAHFGHHVHLAHGGRGVGAAVLERNVLEGAGRRQIADRIARPVLQNVVCHGHQGVLFAEHIAVFANKGQPVDVGVDGNAQLGFMEDHGLRKLGKVIGQRLGIMAEMPVGFAVQQHVFATERIE